MFEAPVFKSRLKRSKRHLTKPSLICSKVCHFLRDLANIQHQISHDPCTLLILMILVLLLKRAVFKLYSVIIFEHGMQHICLRLSIWLHVCSGKMAPRCDLLADSCVGQQQNHPLSEDGKYWNCSTFSNHRPTPLLWFSKTPEIPQPITTPAIHTPEPAWKKLQDTSNKQKPAIAAIHTGKHRIFPGDTGGCGATNASGGAGAAASSAWSLRWKKGSRWDF